MEMEAETPEPVDIMKMDVKEIPASQLGTVSDKAPLGELQQIEDEFLRPGTAESSTSTDKSESIQSCRNGTVYLNTEEKMSNFESDSSSESPSLAIKVSEDISEASKDNEERVNPVLTETEDAENVREFRKEQTDETVEPTGGNMTTGDKEAFTEMSSDNARAEDFGPLNSSEWTKEQTHFVNNGETYPSRPITTFSDDLNQQEGHAQENEPVVDDSEQKNETFIADKQGPDEEHLHSSGIIHHQDFGETTDDRRDEEVFESRSTQDEAATSSEIDKTEDKKSGEDPDFKLVEQDKVNNIEAESYIIPVLETPNKSLKEEANQPVLHKEELECKEESSNFVSMVESASPARDISPDKTSQGAAESEKTIIPILVVTEEKGLQESRVEENRLPDNTAPSLDETSIRPIELQRASKAEDATESETQDNDTIDRVDSVLEKSQINQEKTEQNDIEVAYEVEKNDVNPNSANGNMEGTLTKQENKGPKIVGESEDTQKAIRKEDSTCTVQDLAPMPTGEPQKDESSKENDEGRMPKEEMNEEPITSGDEKNAKQNKEADSTIETLRPEEFRHDENQVKRIENAGAENIGESTIEEDIVPDLSTTTGTEAVQDDHEKDKVFEGLKKISMDEEEDVVDQAKATNEEETIKHGHEEEVIAELEVAEADFDAEETSVEEIVLKNSTTIVKEKPHEDGHDQNEITGRSQTVSVGEGVGDTIVENDVPGPSETTMKDGHQEEKGIEELETTGAYKDISEAFAYEVADLDQSITTIEDEPLENDHEIRKVTGGSHIADAEVIGESKGEKGFIPNHSETSAKEQANKDDREEEETSKEILDSADPSIIEPIVEECVALNPHTTNIKDEKIIDGQGNKIRQGFQIDVGKDIGETNKEEDVVVHSEIAIGTEPINDGYQEEKVNEEAREAGADKETKELIREEIVGPDHSTTIIGVEQNEDDREEIIEKDIVQDHSRETNEDEKIKEGYEEEKVNVELETANAEEIINSPIKEEVIVLSHSTKITKDEPSEVGHEENKVTEGAQLAGVENDIGEIITEVISSKFETAITKIPIKDDQEEEKVIEEIEVVSSDKDSKEHIIAEFVENQSTTIITNEPIQDGHEVNKIMGESHIACITEVDVVPSHSEITIGEVKINDGHKEEKVLERTEIAGADEDTRESTSVIPDHSTTTNDKESTTDGHENKVTGGSHITDAEDRGVSNVEKDSIHSETIAEEQPCKYDYEKKKTSKELLDGEDNSNIEPIMEELVALNPHTTDIKDETITDIQQESKVPGGAQLAGVDNDVREIITEVISSKSETAITKIPIKDDQGEEKIIEELELVGSDKDSKEHIIAEFVENQSTTIITNEPVQDGHEVNKITGESQIACITEVDVPSHSEITIGEVKINDGHKEEKVLERTEIAGADEDTRESTSVIPDHSTTTNDKESTTDGHENKVTRGSHIADVEDRGVSNVEKYSIHSETITEEQPRKYDYEEQKTSKELLDGEDNRNIEPTLEEHVALKPHTTEIKDETIIDGQQERKVRQGFQNDVGKDIGETIKEEDVAEHSEGTIGKEPKNEGYQDGKVNEEIREAAADKETTELIREEIVGADHPTTIIEDEATEEIIKKDIVQDHSKETTEDERIKDGYEEEKVNEELEVTNAEIINNQIQEEVIVLSQSTKNTKDEPSEVGQEENKITEGAQMAGADNDIGETITEEDVISSQFETAIAEKPIKNGQEEEKVVEILEQVGSNKDSREQIIAEFVQSQSTVIITDKPVQDGHEVNKVTETSQRACIAEEEVVPSYSETTIMEVKINDGQKDEVRPYKKESERPEIAGADRDNRESTSDIPDHTRTTNDNDSTTDGHEDKVSFGSKYAGLDKDINESIKENIVPSDYDRTTGENPIKYVHEKDKVTEGLEIAGADIDNKESNTKEDAIPDHSTTTAGKETTENVAETIGVDNDIGDPIIEDDVVIHHSVTTVGEELNSDGLNEAKMIEADGFLNNSKTTTGEEQSRDGKEEDKVFEELEVATKGRDIGEPAIEDAGVPNSSITSTEDEPIRDEYQEDKVHESLKADAEVDATTKEILEDDNVIDLLETSIEEEIQKNICQEYETTVDACATQLSTDSNRVEISMEDPQEDKMETKKHTEAGQYNECLEPNSDTPDSTEMIETQNLDEGEEQRKNCNADAVIETIVGQKVQKASSDVLRDTSSGINFKTADMADMVETMNFNGEDLHKSQTADTINEDTETIQNKSSEILQEASSFPGASEEQRKEGIIEDNIDTNDRANNASLEKEMKMIGSNETEENNNNLPDGLDRDASIIYIETTTSKKEQGPIETIKEYPVEEIKKTEVTDHLIDHEIQTKQVVAYSDLASVEQNFEPVGLSQERVVESENKHAGGLITTNRSLEEPAKEVAKVILEEKVSDEDEDIPKEAEHNGESCEMNTEPDIVIPPSLGENGIDGSSTLSPKSELESMKLERTDGSYSTEVTDHSGVMDNNGDAKTMKEQSSSAIFETDAVKGEDTHERNMAEDGAVNDQTSDPRDKAVGQSWIGDEQENIKSNTEEKDEDPFHMNAVNYSTITKTQNEEAIQSLEVAGASMEVEKYIIQEKEVELDHSTMYVGEEAVKQIFQEKEQEKTEKEAPGETVSAENDAKQFMEDDASTQTSSALVEDVNISTHGEQLHEIKEATIDKEAVETPTIKEMPAEESCMASLEEQAIKESSQEAEVHDDLKKADVEKDAGNQTMEYEAGTDVSMKLVEAQAADLSSHENENEKEQHGGEVEHSDLVFTQEATDSSNETEVGPLEEEGPKKSLNDFSATETSLAEITEMESPDNLDYTSTRLDISESIDGTTENKSKNHEPTCVTLEDNLSSHEAEKDGGGLVDATNLASVGMVSTPNEENRTSSQDSKVENVKHKTVSIEENATENIFIADNSDVAEAGQEKSETADETEQEKSEIPEETSLLVMQSVHKDIETTPKVETIACKTSSDDMSENKPQEVFVMASDKQELDTTEMKQKIKDEFPVQDEFIDKRETLLVAKTEGDVQDEEHVKLEGNETETKTTEQKISVPSNSENDDPEKEKDVRDQTMEYAARPDVSMKLVEEQTSEVRSHENESEKEKEQHSGEVKHSDLVCTKEATDSSNIIKEAPLEEEYLKKSLNDFRATETSLEEITEMESCDNLNYTSTRSDISESIHGITENTSRNHEPTYVTLFEDNLSSHEAEEDGGGLVDVTNLASAGMVSTPNEENRASSQDSNVEDVKHQTISIEDNATENTFIADNSEAAEVEQEKSEIADEAEQGKSEIPAETSAHVIESVHKNIEITPKVETTVCEKSSDDMSEHKPEEVSVMASEKQEFDTIERKEKIKDEFPIEDEIIDKRETSLVTQTEGDVQNKEHVKLEENEIETEITELKIAVPSNTENDTVMASEKQEFHTMERKEKIKDEFPIENEIMDKRETSLVTQTEGDVQNEEHVKLEENEIETEITEPKIAVPPNTENDNLEKEKDPLKKPDPSLEESNNETKVEENLAEPEVTDQSTKISGSYDLIENVALAQNLEAVVQCDEPKGVVLAESTVDKEDVKEIIPIENIQLTESENLEKGDHIPVSPSSTKETSVDVDEQYKVDSDFEAGMHNEGVAKSYDTVNAGDERAEEISQKDKMGDIIKEAKCESEPLSPSMTKETSVEGDEQCKVDSDAEANIHNGGIDKICDTVTSGDVRGEKISQEDKKGDTVKEDKCELEEEQKKQSNVEIEATEHETLADELQVPKKLDNISDTENNESNILGETADPTLSCQTAHSDRSYTDKITEGLKEEDNVNDEVDKLVNEEFVSESNTENVRREETYEANEKLENEFPNQEIKFPNQEVLEELGNSGGIHDTVKQLIKEEKLIKDPNLVVVGEESLQNAQGGENFEEAGIEKEPITLEQAKPYLGQGVKDEGLERNGITTDEIVNGMLGSSHVALAEKDTTQEDITGGTGPVSVEEDKSGKCDSLLIGNAQSEEVSVEVGKQVEVETDFIPDEQIRETNTKKPENTETVSKDTSGPEGFVEVMKPSDSVLDTVTLSTTDNLHIKEDLPADDTNVTSFKEASQQEIEEKEGQSTEVAEKQEVLFITEPTNKILEESRKDIEHEALTAETLPESEEIINELELQEKLCPNEDRDNQPLKHPDTPDTTAEKLISMEADSVTRTEENISVTSKEVSSLPRGMSGTSLQATEVKSEKHEETLRNDLEMNEEISEDKEKQNQGEEKNTDSKSLEGVSLFNLLSKTKEATSPILADMEETRENNKEIVESKEAPEIETEKEDKTEEYDDEPKKDDSGSDAPVIVEDSKDIDIKTTPKKSHGILSGVGSKVKHSISKVKKAITGKSSHQKHSPTK